MAGPPHDVVRDQNLAAVLRRVHYDGPQSRAALTAALGLTRTTVGVLVKELVGYGLVTETPGEASGDPGRPSPVVHPRTDSCVVLAAEIAADSLTVARVSLGGVVQDQVRVNRSNGNDSPREVVSELLALLQQQRDASRATVIGCGIALHGVIRRADGYVHLASNLNWRDFALGQLLAEKMGGSFPISVENDANLGGLAEVLRGAARGRSPVLYISSEVGIGGGFIINSQPFVGADGYASEIGHLQVNPNGSACRCGSRGCWETEVGEIALLRRAGRPTTSGRDREVAAVIEACEAGDQRALDAAHETGRWFGLGLASLANVLNPTCIVIAGPLAKLHPFIKDVVRDVMEERALSPSASVPIVPSSLRDDAPIMGAAEIALAPILNNPRLSTIQSEDHGTVDGLTYAIGRSQEVRTERRLPTG